MPTLEWIGKNKVVNHHLEVPYRVLERQYSYDEHGQRIEDNNSENMIIHGDNLSALKSLLPRYEGRIKCIYIDPPYNTGNEGWVYNDNVNDPRIKRWLGEVVGSENEDLSRHDKWLCMMYPRLKLLQRLMSEDGAIFMDGKIDMIITKSISRFARNTLDCLKYIRQLKDKNIPVFFEKETINTMDAKGEVLLTIMASLAQQESQSLSQNVKLGLQYRYQQGLVQVNHNRFMGYTKDEDGKLIIEPREAEIVKRIYREYLEGQSFLQIGRGLERDGILTGAGKQRWRPESVKKILTNEKYIGDALLQKTYTVDFLTKKRVSNNGIVPQYYVENSHPAIIPRDLYMQVQEEILRRANIHSGTEQKKRVYSSRYALSSIVVCGHCGDIFRRIKWNNRGCKSTVWRCVSRVEKGGPDCSARTVKEETLQEVVVKAVNEMMADQETFLPLLQANIESALDGNSEEAIATIDEKLMELQKELLKLANAKKDYEPIADEIDRLREEKQNILVDDAGREGTRQRVQEMMEYLQEQLVGVAEYDEQLVRRLIEKIMVYDEKFVVEFKAGVAITIKK